MPKKKTTAEFIADAKKIHGDKYDYSKVVYRGVYEPVIIGCPIHGDFTKRPYDHLTLKQGCKQCSIEQQANRQRKGVDYFLENAKKTHGDKYDYSKMEYVDLSTPILIGCPDHGYFWQKPHIHLKGTGCPTCGNLRTADKLRGTTDSFVQRALLVWGDRYDYSNTEYTNARQQLTVVCRRHGPFKLFPHEHLNGRGCPACLNNERFIEKARAVHGNKYDYSSTEYQSIDEPVTITCHIHGDFTQTPHAHLRGRGCPACGVESRTALKRNTTEGFIADAIRVHGDEYDYSRVHYVNCDERVEIICKIHGSFFQTPFQHNNMGQGCPKCAAIRRGAESRKPKEQFIREANIVHGGKYDYSLVEYTITSQKVKIICPIHGVFEQIARDHLNGAGCKKCYADSKRHSLPELIEKFNQIHKGKYSYDKVEYKNVKEKILVTCPIHGDFLIRPDQHLDGFGCHECAISANESQLEREVREMLERRNYSFIQEKSFPWLRSKYPLFLDFYLPEYNIAIECQGAQHFYATDFFGGQKSFKESQHRDKVKKELCNKNGITVLYYSNLGIDYPYLVADNLDSLIRMIENIGIAEHPIWLPDPTLPLSYE